MQDPTNIKLKSALLPKMLSDLTHSNQFLKFFSLTLLLLMFMLLGVVLVMTTKEPLVITLGPDGKSFERTVLPKQEDQVREAVKHYIEKRYQWEPKNVLKKLKTSESFILPNVLKAFQAAVSNVAKFSTEKVVSQKIYPEKILINLEKSTALITGDRVTTIQGMKAAGTLKLELTYENGPRTAENPWGLYISKEREE